SAPLILGHVDPGQNADRNGEEGTKSDENQRADDGVGHAAAEFANRLGRVDEELPVERLHAPRDDEKQNERQRHEREQYRESAERDEQPGDALAPEGGPHAGAP